MIEDIKEAKELLGEYDDLSDNTIDDILTEIADSCVDVYTSDRRKWLCEGEENVEKVGEAISEFGWGGCGGDLIGAIGLAQYSANRQLLWEAWEEIQE